MTAAFRMRAVGPEIDLVTGRSTRAFAPHSHDQYGLGLVLAGGQRSRSRDGMVEARRGDMINVLPGEVHDGAPLDDAGRTWTILYLSVPYMERLMLDLTGGRQAETGLAKPVVTDRAALQLLRVALDAASDSSTGDAVEEALLPLLGRLAGGVAPARTCTDAVRRARSRIDDDPAHAHTLDSLAAGAGIGKFHLIRSFAAATGLTPHAYLMQARLRLARQWVDAGLPLAEAALSAGFADQAHFTRLFVRAYGVTPSQFARRAGAA